MPRYFFHLHTESRIDPDVIGVEFRSLEVAVADARRARIEYMRDEGIENDRLRRRCRFEITDERSQVVATVPVPDN
jgi:hypothetical protein